MICVYFMMGGPEGSAKSGFMERPGIEPATPWFTRHRLITYTTAASSKKNCGIPGYKPVPSGWFNWSYSDLTVQQSLAN